MTGDGRSRDADADTDESWTQMEDARPDLVEAVPIRHGMVLGGRYAVETIIGRGGSGVVVRAHDRDLQQEVAIKIVRAELAGQRMSTASPWSTRTPSKSSGEIPERRSTLTSIPARGGLHPWSARRIRTAVPIYRATSASYCSRPVQPAAARKYDAARTPKGGTQML